MKQLGAVTMGALLANPLFLIILAIGLIVLAVSGILILIFASHWVIAFALVVLAYVVLKYAPLPPQQKFIIAIILFVTAIVVFIYPGMVGL